MISTLLVEHPWLTTAGLIAVVVIGPLVGWWLATRRRLAWVLAGVALIAVLAVTMLPDERIAAASCELIVSPPSLGAVELVANLLLFVPPVLLAGVASRRPLLALLGGALLSALIEVAQLAIPAIGRSCTANDWVYNTAGAVLGAVLALVALRLARRRVRPADATAR